MAELTFDDLIDDVLGVINSFLDYRSTAALKQTCKRMSSSIIDYNFYTDEYARYNPSYNRVYPLLIEDQKELVVSTNIIRGQCTRCGEEKEINEYGYINIEEEIETPEKFKSIKLSNIIYFLHNPK